VAFNQLFFVVGVHMFDLVEHAVVRAPRMGISRVS
jgi:hypothetical protein